jgi:pyridoxine 5-phosphate synthase
MAVDAESFGAQGITVHPRPDERHITYEDVLNLKPLVKTEYNIEGNPTEQKFVDLVLQVKPDQVTLVPDSLGQLTSNHGWDTVANKAYLTDIIAVFKAAGIRTSIFVDADVNMVSGAKEVGTDRIELYTESYAHLFETDTDNSIAPFIAAAKKAEELGLGLNAGHDLNLKNLAYFKNNLPNLLEVSIGHALVSDALYYGWENTIRMYRAELEYK